MSISRFLTLAAVSALSLAGCAATGGSRPAHPLLGSGRGIDHATVLTRDLASTSSMYTNSLGFTVTPYDKYENGFENAGADGVIREGLWGDPRRTPGGNLGILRMHLDRASVGCTC